MTDFPESELLAHLATKASKTTIPLHVVKSSQLRQWTGKQSKSTRTWLTANGFKAEPGQHCVVPDRQGGIGFAVATAAKGSGPFGLARLPSKLPAGRYEIAGDLTEAQADDIALGWALGTYAFSRYKSRTKKYASLVWPKEANRQTVTGLLGGIALTRDLINTPASDMGPVELADAAANLATRHGAKCTTIVGKKLLEKNFPAIHAVGRASTREPRLIDIRWGDPGHPKVTLVGKGVCFDTGGLDLKNSAGMKLMKKDMGGAANVLGLAHIIMHERLPVRLRVLIPAVENSVSGNAYRPLDVLTTRKGLTVEVGNTDAEGRIVLCDALAEADSENPELLIDMATLTGAARVALGTDLPALFCNDEEVAADIIEAGSITSDPLWRMPLHRAYRKSLDSPVADINNISGGAFGGAITAALYLQEFVADATPWVHIDAMAWNLESRPGRPSGGEACGIRALAQMLRRRFA